MSFSVLFFSVLAFCMHPGPGKAKSKNLQDVREKSVLNIKRFRLKPQSKIIPII